MVFSSNKNRSLMWRMSCERNKIFPRPLATLLFFLCWLALSLCERNRNWMKFSRRRRSWRGKWDQFDKIPLEFSLTTNHCTLWNFQSMKEGFYNLSILIFCFDINVVKLRLKIAFLPCNYLHWHFPFPVNWFESLCAMKLKT